MSQLLNYSLDNFVKSNIMKCQTWLLGIAESKTFLYLISKQKYLEKELQICITVTELFVVLFFFWKYFLILSNEQNCSKPVPCSATDL